jgi:hypothetical protein
MSRLLLRILNKDEKFLNYAFTEKYEEINVNEILTNLVQLKKIKILTMSQFTSAIAKLREKLFKDKTLKNKFKNLDDKSKTWTDDVIGHSSFTYFYPNLYSKLDEEMFSIKYLNKFKVPK